MDLKFIKEYTSINQASELTGINHKNISSCVRKDLNYSAGNYRWSFIKINNN